MANSRDRILLVESDPVVSDLIGRQALQASGFQVLVVSDASTAISKALQWAPDLIITDLLLPGLSGKDLMVALTSQGIKTPVIILAQRGMEADIVQTFRVGASDYLLLPVREAEVIAAVNHALQQVHERRERDRLAQQLQQTNLELQARVRELTAIFAVGKAVTSVTDQASLLEKVLDGALRVTQADLGWFLLRDEGDSPFVLAAERNLPASLGARLNQAWDDGISSLVAMSGEPLSIYGEPIKRFKISILGGSALIAPIKVQQKRVVGLLVVMHRQSVVFNQSEQHLLGALADYASISLVNARLFKTMDDRARSLQQMTEVAQIDDKINVDILEGVKIELSSAVSASLGSLEKLAKDPTARWRPDQRQLISSIQDRLLILQQISASISPLQMSQARKERKVAPLNDPVRQAIQRLNPSAQSGGLTLSGDLVSEPVMVCTEYGLLDQVLDGLLSSVIRFSTPGSIIRVGLLKESEQGHLVIHTSGISVPLKEFEKMFDEQGNNGLSGVRFGGLSIRPGLVKEIVTFERGKIWLEGQSGKDITLHFVLPLAR